MDGLAPPRLVEPHAATALTEALIADTRAALARQEQSGAMAPGHNGAYGQPETPVRNTAHWLMSFSRAYQLTNDVPFKRGAERALRYLLDVIAIFPGAVICRHAPGKDASNGTIGPAIIAEGLFAAAEALHSDEAFRAGSELMMRHPFDPELHVWRRLTPSGGVLSPDSTFNHQLYFAAIAALYAPRCARLREGVAAFVAGLPHTLRVRANGCIVHHLPSHGAHALKAQWQDFRRKNAPTAKEADYHLYNMYLFALLHRAGVAFEDHAFDQWAAIRKFTESATIQNRLLPAAWTTSLRSGTETAACDYAFYHAAFGGNDVESAIENALEHLRFLGGPDRSYTLFSPDPLTQRARIYRYWRLLS